MGEELHLVHCATDGFPSTDEGMVAALLAGPVVSVEPSRANDAAARRQSLEGMRAHAEGVAAEPVTRQRMPNDLVLLEAVDAS